MPVDYLFELSEGSGHTLGSLFRYDAGRKYILAEPNRLSIPFDECKRVRSIEGTNGESDCIRPDIYGGNSGHTVFIYGT